MCFFVVCGFQCFIVIDFKYHWSKDTNFFELWWKICTILLKYIKSCGGTGTMEPTTWAYDSGIVGPVAARRSRPLWDEARATSRREAKERSDAAIVTVAARGD